MVIIAPSQFADSLQPLIDHKNSYGLRTFLKTTGEIYAEYAGRDNMEQIKFFINDAKEIWKISYVLLVGSVNTLPMRKALQVLSEDPKITLNVLTDLYYADIKDSMGVFCSWDANNNNIFGEKDDELDFYPDVHIGRLPCDTSEDVEIVVDKIIHYERETYGQPWFNKMIFMGGDTWPESFFEGAIYREGEKHNQVIMDIMSDFNQIVIWTSKGNFNRETIANAVNGGAGFLFYSGHGIEFALIPEMQLPSHTYLSKYMIQDFQNGYKLPIMFFSGCSVARLDFSLETYFPTIIRVLSHLPFLKANQLIPCFAWNAVKQKYGGAIAAIGSTELVGVNNWTEGGYVNTPMYFFNTYNKNITLGEMMSQAIISNIHDIPNDFLAELTIKEHVLLGDPSLKIGGYS